MIGNPFKTHGTATLCLPAKAVSDSRKTVKLDLEEFGLKSFFSHLTVLADLGLGSALLFLVAEAWPWPPSPIPMSSRILSFLAILALLGCVHYLQRTIECYRFVDPRARALYESCRFLKFEKVKKLADAQSVLAIGPRAQNWRGGKGKTWCKYQLVLVRKDGRIVPLTCRESFDISANLSLKAETRQERRCLNRLTGEAKRVASELGCPVFIGRLRMDIRVRKNASGSTEIHFISGNAAESWRAVKFAAILLLLLGGVYSVLWLFLAR